MAASQPSMVSDRRAGEDVGDGVVVSDRPEPAAQEFSGEPGQDVRLRHAPPLQRRVGTAIVAASDDELAAVARFLAQLTDTAPSDSPDPTGP